MRAETDKGAMSDAYIDVNERLVWSRTKLHRKRMIVFAVGTIAAVVIVVLADSPLERWALARQAWFFSLSASTTSIK